MTVCMYVMLQSLHGDGPGGRSSDNLRKLNQDIDELVKEVRQLNINCETIQVV